MNDKDNDHRECESKLASDVLQKSDEEILKEIFYHSSIPPHHDSQLALNRTLAYFSALLLRLSRQAEESTKKIVKLTKILTYLTLVIAILTAVILFVSFFEFPKKSKFGNQKTNQAEQYTHQNQSNKTNEIHK